MSNFFKVASQSQLPLIDNTDVFVGDMGYTLDDGGFWNAAQPSAPPGADPVWSFIDVLRGPPGPQGDLGVGLPGPQGQIGPPGLIGGRGPQGPAGRNAFSQLVVAMRVPDVGDQPLSISVTDTSWMVGGLLIYIPGAGTFTIVGNPTDPNVAQIANSGDPANAPAGTMIGAGVSVSAANLRGPTGPSGIPGPVGPPGPQGVSGAAAFSSLTQAFTLPNTSTPSVAFVLDSQPFAAGQIVYLEGGDYCSVISTNDTNNSITLQNLGYLGTAVGTVIPIGNSVSGTGPRGPAGPQGIQGIQGPQGLQGTAPTGAVMMYAATTAPSGWLLCQGQAISKTAFSALFSIIADTFRNPSNADTSTFNVPDLRDNFPIGASATKALATKGGAATHTPSLAEMPAHTHTMGNHTHPGADHTHSMQGHTHIGGNHGHEIPAGQFNHNHVDAGHQHTFVNAVHSAGGTLAGGGTFTFGAELTGSASANIQPNTLPLGVTAGVSGIVNQVLLTSPPSTPTTGFADRSIVTGGPSTNTTSSTGNATPTPFSIIPPYLSMSYIIKT